MDVKTRCQTPGAFYDITITPREVVGSVRLPMELDLTEHQAAELEDAIHNALEAVLAPHWRPWTATLALRIRGRGYMGRHRR